MRSSLTAALLIVCLLFSQLPIAASAQAAQPANVTLPAGTVVPLTLVSQIKNKSSKPGDSIRAVVAFPVTVGAQVAIPAGTYVEGTLLSLTPKARRQPDAGVQIHFTQLIFANGYRAPLDAIQTAELNIPPAQSAASPQFGAMALSAALYSFDPAQIWNSIGFHLPTFASGWRSWLMSPQAFPPVTMPTPPTLPKTGVPAGLIAGLAVAVAIPIVIGILFHHRGTSDFIVHDAGWQFQMKLAAPLSLNTALIAPKNP